MNYIAALILTYEIWNLKLVELYLFPSKFVLIVIYDDFSIRVQCFNPTFLKVVNKHRSISVDFLINDLTLTLFLLCKFLCRFVKLFHFSNMLAEWNESLIEWGGLFILFL